MTLRATVSPSTATGTVTFYDSGTTLSTVPLSNGQAAMTTSALAAPYQTLTAVYSGDATYASTTSPKLTQLVDQAPTTTNLTSSPSPSYAGESVTLTASVSPPAATGLSNSTTVR